MQVDEKQNNENIISVIDNDFVLNFISDYDQGNLYANNKYFYLYIIYFFYQFNQISFSGLNNGSL